MAILTLENSGRYVHVATRRLGETVTTSEIVLTVLLVMAVALAAVLFFILRRSSQPSKPTNGSERSNELELLEYSLDLPPGSKPLFEPAKSEALQVGDAFVIINPMEPTQGIVIGGRGREMEFGEVIGPVPRQLAGLAVGADALVRAGIAMGEQSGMLVRLSRETTEAMQTMQKTFDSSGRMLGLFRDSGGKFLHVARFSSANSLQILSGVTGALGAIAMQAQLASIEKAIARVGADVRRVQGTLDRSEDGARDAIDQLINDIYRGARSTGTLNRSGWDQLAPHTYTVLRNRSVAFSTVDDLLGELSAKRSTKQRREWFERNEMAITKAMTDLEQAEQALLQFMALRVWWLGMSGDTSTEHYVAEIKSELNSMSQRRQELQSRAVEVLDQAHQTTWWDWTHSPFDTHATESRVESLRQRLTSRGLLPSHEEEPTPNPTLSTDQRAIDYMIEGEIEG